MQLLLIKIQTLDAQPEYALLGKKQKEDRFTPGDWTKVRSLTRGRRVLLIIPNEDVVLTSLKIPSKNKKQLLKAVPYALEDTFAEDVEDLHFAIYQEDVESKVQVAVINRNLLDKYVLLLRKNGITTHFLLPQVLIQPIKKDAWSILQGNNSTISIRLNAYYGFSCEESLLDVFIQQLDLPKPELILSNISTEKLPEELQEYSIESIDSNKVFFGNISSALSLNLLSGFVSKKKQSTINWKVWEPTIVIASFVVISWIGILAWQNILLQKQSRQLKQSIENTYLSAFPGGRIVDPPQQMASKLAQLKKNSGKTVDSPLPLLADIAPLLNEYKDLALNEVRFRENKLELVVQSPNITRLERFKRDAVKKSRLQVIINSSTTTANKVKAILLISPLTTISNRDEEEKA